MTLEKRVQRAQAARFEAEDKFDQLCRKTLQIEVTLAELVQEWRIVSTKHAILIAEIKKNLLLGDYPSPSGSTLLIQ